MRLIAPHEVIDAAERLHLAGADAMDVAFNGPVPPDPAWSLARQRQQECRDRFIGEVRKSLRVGKSPYRVRLLSRRQQMSAAARSRNPWWMSVRRS
ncbi:hypothetical protein, partial [Nocardia niigatensis]